MYKRQYVYFSLEMASLLKEYRSFCQGELELHEGRELTTEDYIFRRHGADLPMTPSTFTWRFKLILTKHGLPLDLSLIHISPAPAWRCSRTMCGKTPWNCFLAGSVSVVPRQ